GQTMDVESPASWGSARNQRTPYSHQSKRAVDHVIAGRDPLIFHPRVSRQTRRLARHIGRNLVRSAQGGRIPLFCAEYCGTDHSRMTGRIVVMQQPEFETWLARQDVNGTLASQGASLFRQLGCSGCHGNGSKVRAPALEGLYGSRVSLSDGTMEIADERFIRDSILKPRAKIAAGYQALMPAYEGKISEDEVVKIIAYVKSLGGEMGVPQ